MISIKLNAMEESTLPHLTDTEKQLIRLAVLRREHVCSEHRCRKEIKF